MKNEIRSEENSMITQAPFIKRLCAVADNMYRLGWNERNGGNISLLIDENEFEAYGLSVKRLISLSVKFPALAGKCFVVTGTGKCFRNISSEPEDCLGIIRINSYGDAELLWGYADGGRPTSEITMHLGAHRNRLETDKNQRVVLHAHPANIVAMTHVHSLDESEFTKTLWGTITECIVIFPEGVGVLPWMLSSSDRLGLISAEKFREYRALVWAMHGITAAGDSLDETFGLMETIEKAAQIYMLSAGFPKQARITDEMLKQVADSFGLKIKEW